jgi:hypothetical protein
MDDNEQVGSGYLPSPKKSQTSPKRPASYGLNGRKEKRQPSITPRKFSRFFTPRSHGSLSSRSSRRALFDITTPANNRSGIQSSPIRPYNTSGRETSPTTFTRELKRRKLIHTPISSPEHTEPDKSSPCGQSLFIDDNNTNNVNEIPTSPCLSVLLEDSGRKIFLNPSVSTIAPPAPRIKRLGERGLVGQLVERNLSSHSTSLRQHVVYPTPGK